MPGSCADILTVLLQDNFSSDSTTLMMFGGGIVFFIWLYYYSESKANEKTDGFFKALARQDMDRASGYLARNLSAASQHTLRELLRTNAFAGYKKARWTTQYFTGGTGLLEGYIIMKGGFKTPFRLGFVQEKGVWKINSVEDLPPDYDPPTPF